MVGRLITILSLVHFLKFVNTQVTYPSAVNLTVVNVTHTGQTSSVTVAWDPPRVTAHQVLSYTVQIQSPRDSSIFQLSTYAVGSNLMHTFRRLKPGITYAIDVIVSYEGGDSNAIRITVRLNYDECERGTHNCDHICIDTPSSYLCSCRSGYTLKNQYQCIAIDPCTNGNHSCTADQLCHSSNGSYSCSSYACDQGFRVSNNTCIDVDECQSNTDGCQHNCTNTDGSYECSCWDGYRLGADNHSCTVIPVPPVITRSFRTVSGVVLLWKFPSSPVDWFIITVSILSIGEDDHVTKLRMIRVRGVVRAFYITRLERGKRYKIEVTAKTGQVESSPAVFLVDKI